MRTLAICCIAPFLGGCWFVYIPGSMVSSITDSIGGYSGQHCIAEGANVGNKVKFQDGRIATVVKLEGLSSRCQDPKLPVRAVLSFDNAPQSVVIQNPSPLQQ